MWVLLDMMKSSRMSLSRRLCQRLQSSVSSQTRLDSVGQQQSVLYRPSYCPSASHEVELVTLSLYTLSHYVCAHLHLVMYVAEGMCVEITLDMPTVGAMDNKTPLCLAGSYTQYAAIYPTCVQTLGNSRRTGPDQYWFKPQD